MIKGGVWRNTEVRLGGVRALVPPQGLAGGGLGGVLAGAQAREGAVSCCACAGVRGCCSPCARTPAGLGSAGASAGKGTEHRADEEQLRELEGLSLQKRRLRDGSSASPQLPDRRA